MPQGLLLVRCLADRVEGAADADFSFLFRVNERIFHMLTLQALCVQREVWARLKVHIRKYSRCVPIS